MEMITGDGMNSRGGEAEGKQGGGGRRHSINHSE